MIETKGAWDHEDNTLFLIYRMSKSNKNVCKNLLVITKDFISLSTHKYLFVSFQVGRRCIRRKWFSVEKWHQQENFPMARRKVLKSPGKIRRESCHLQWYLLNWVFHKHQTESPCLSWPNEEPNRFLVCKQSDAKFASPPSSKWWRAKCILNKPRAGGYHTAYASTFKRDLKKLPSKFLNQKKLANTTVYTLFIF